MVRASSVVNCQFTLAWRRSAFGLPSRDLIAQDGDGVDASVQALANHDVELDPRDVEPAAVLRGEDKLAAITHRALARVGGKAS